MQTVGPYEVVSELGRGGMGVVFAARGEDGRQVAIKVLKGDANDRSLARFQRERRLLASLSETEGFVPLIDSGESSEGPYLVMPLYHLGTLRQRLTGTPHEVKWTVALGERLAASLGHAHAQGIVHRDLKPENVLFGDDGLAYVSDLGLAKHYSPAGNDATRSESLSKPGDFIGTAGYMSPEQLRDAKGAVPSSDVFALGAILYECLTGRRCFEGESIFQVIAKIQRHEIEPISQVRRDVPSWLARVIDRALAHDPALRYSNGADLARALAARGRAPLEAKTVAVRLAMAGVLAGAVVVGALILLRPGPPEKPPVLHAILKTGGDSSDKTTEARGLGPESPRVKGPAADDGVAQGKFRVADGTTLSVNPDPQATVFATGSVGVGGAGPLPHVFSSVASSNGSARDPAERPTFSAAALSPDGERIALVDSSSVAVVSSGAPTQSRKGSVKALAFAGDRVVLAEGTGILWDPSTGREQKLAHPGTVTAVAGAGDLAVTGSEDGAIRLWRIAGDVAPCGELRVKDAVIALAASSTRIAVLTASGVVVFDREGKEVATVPTTGLAIALSEKGDLGLLTADAVLVYEAGKTRPGGVGQHGGIAVGFPGGRFAAVLEDGRVQPF